MKAESEIVNTLRERRRKAQSHLLTLAESWNDGILASWWHAHSGDCTDKTYGIPYWIIKKKGSKSNMREFETGATRDTDDGKLDYEGFLSPLALKRYAQYMHQHRVQADGKLRDSDNWQKGIPFDAYMKSMFRHVMDLWALHRGIEVIDPKDSHAVTKGEALCATIFNAFGYLHEHIKVVGLGGSDAKTESKEAACSDCVAATCPYNSFTTPSPDASECGYFRPSEKEVTCEDCANMNCPNLYNWIPPKASECSHFCPTEN